MHYKTVEGELGVAVFELIIFSGVHFQTLVAFHPPRLYSPNGSTQAFPYLSLAKHMARACRDRVRKWYEEEMGFCR